MSKTTNKPPRDFEQAMVELEQIVHDMEVGKTTLEESLAKFERGTFLIEHCRKLLTSAERKIQELTRGADGKLSARTADIDDAAGSEESPSMDAPDEADPE